MSLIIDMEPQKEARLNRNAAARGVDASTYAQRLLDEALEREDERERQTQHEKNQRTIAWLQSHVDEANAMTEEERVQAEAEWRDTARSIDANRTSSRKLFSEYSDDPSPAGGA